MEKDRVKNLCETVLSYAFSGVSISEFEVISTSIFDEVKDSWEEFSFCIFMSVKDDMIINENTLLKYDRLSLQSGIEKTIESYLGFDCSVVVEI